MFLIFLVHEQIHLSVSEVTTVCKVLLGYPVTVLAMAKYFIISKYHEYAGEV